MSNIFDIDENRAKCQKFTPEKMVAKLLEIIDYSTDLYGKKVLENSFGNGNILIAIVEKYIKECLKSGLEKKQISSGLADDIIGIELDQKLFCDTLDRLNCLADKYELPKVNWNIHNYDALKYKYNVVFDYIIGNPPYISYKQIDTDNRNYLRTIFKSCQKGKFDYCYAFVELGISLLSEEGKMVQLVPSNIFKNVFAKHLRELMFPHISEIYEYPSKVLFESTLTSSCIFLYDKSNNDDVVKYYNITDSTSNIVNKIFLSEKWMFTENIPSNDDKSLRFGDYYDASIVIATLCNEAFIVSEKNIKENNLEKELIRHAVSPRSLRYKKQEYIIFPYRYENDKLKKYSSEDFLLKFPNIGRYLNRYRKELDNRNSDNSAKWFEYGRSQALSHLNCEKLLLSTIVTDSVNLYVLDSDTIPYSGIYIYPKTDEYDLDFAKQILKSPEFMDYVKKIGIPVSGTSIRITCNDIKNYKFTRR